MTDSTAVTLDAANHAQSLDTTPAAAEQHSEPSADGDEGEDAGWESIDSMTDAQVRQQLERVRDERDTYETQYRGLLSKLTQMRATLGDRLRQDAEELDRREQQIETLTARTTTLTQDVDLLRNELESLNVDNERLTNELDAALQAVRSAPSRDGDVEESREQLERYRMDAQQWESTALDERSRREDLETRLVEVLEERERAKQSEHLQRQRADREANTAAELQAVLAEFSATQDSDLQRAVSDLESQCSQLSVDVQEWKERAQHAEARLNESEHLATQASTLTQQVKEKNLLIGKLRHEAVILNEHLTEALRRLRNDQSDFNVDKRLVTNLLLQFVTTPRNDGKRFEMLNLIASVLDWTDDQRETAGLQKPTSSSAALGQNSRRKSSTTSNPTTASGQASNASASASNVGGDESFSNLFVEFLLSEAERGTGGSGTPSEPAPDSTTSGPPSRILSPFSPGRTKFSDLPNGSSHTPPPPPPLPRARADSESDPSANSKLAQPDSGGGGISSYFGLGRSRK